MDPICANEGCYMFAPDTPERPSCERACRLASHSGDIARTTAAAVFEKPAEEITPGQRRAGKAINFGVNFGQSPDWVARHLRVTKTWITS